MIQWEQAVLERIASDSTLALELFEPLTALGSVPVLCVVIGTLYLYGFHDQSYLLAAGSIVTGLTALFFKEVVARPRPEFAYREVLTHSFPSAHTALAIVNATLLAWFYPELRYWFGTLAAVVGLSRLVLGVHYPTDVFAGAVIGMSVAWLVWRFSEQVRTAGSTLDPITVLFRDDQ